MDTLFMACKKLREFILQPVSGPYVKVSESPPDQWGNIRYWRMINSYRQAKPYDLALNLVDDRMQCTNAFNSGNNPDWGYGICSQFGIPDAGAAHVPKAREMFVSRIRGQTSELGVLFMERHRALEMVSTRANQFRQFVRHMKRLELNLAANVLGLDRRRFKHEVSIWRKSGRDIGSLILEIFWGWKPLIQDIHASINVLQRPVKDTWYSGRSSGAFEGTWSPQTHATVTQRGLGRATVSGGARIDNPNLWLANQMGLVNPLGMLWEVAPWSFLVDYFVSVGDFLNSFTEFWGISIISPSTTKCTKCVTEYRYFNPVIAHTIRRDGYRVLKQRSTGLPPGPSISLESWRLSPTRAATSIGLLLQQLKTVRA